MSCTPMRDRVAIGQRWQRRRDRQVARIRQIHRADRLVELTLPDAAARPLLVAFTELRTKWRPLEDPAARSTGQGRRP